MLEKVQRGELEDEVFANASISPAALIREILNGPPACYLLSGYRGAGKSTYIKALERQANKEAPDKIIFVAVDFSRHNKNMNLFRWLIRCLYEAINPPCAIPFHRRPLVHQKSPPRQWLS